MKLNMNNSLLRMIISDSMERRGYSEVFVTPSIMDALVKDLFFDGDPEPGISVVKIDKPGVKRELVMDGIKYIEKKEQ